MPLGGKTFEAQMALQAVPVDKLCLTQLIFPLKPNKMSKMGFRNPQLE